MKPFHVVVRALPAIDLPTAVMQLGSEFVETLAVPSGLQATPLGVSFEQAVSELELLQRMHCEPDGSFVWVSPDILQTSWQVDGNLYDRDGSLVSIDLKGTCAKENLSRLFDVFRATNARLMIELTTEAVFVHEADFVRIYC